MKNITISVDEETYQLSRVKAAEVGTAVSVPVRSYLVDLVQGRVPEVRFDRMRRLQDRTLETIRDRGGGLRAADNLLGEHCTSVTCIAETNGLLYVVSAPAEDVEVASSSGPRPAGGKKLGSVGTSHAGVLHSVDLSRAPTHYEMLRLRRSATAFRVRSVTLDVMWGAFEICNRQRAYADGTPSSDWAGCPKQRNT